MPDFVENGKGIATHAGRHMHEVLRGRDSTQLAAEEEAVGAIGGFEVGAGGKGRRRKQTRFEGIEGDGGITRLGFDLEHEVGGSRDGVGTSERAMAIGVMSDDGGGIAGFCKAAKVEESGKDSGQAGFAATAQEVRKGIYDDESRGF